MITWNGITSDSIGVIVERMPNRYVPSRRISPKSVPGRNGDILSIDRSFPNVEQEYEVYLSAESVGLPSVARACAEWLMSPVGYAELKDSYDNSVFREAVLVNGFDIENVLNQFGRCTITFSCKPQKFLYTGLHSITIDPTGHNQTYTGEIVTFEAAASDNITSLTVPFSPIQSLNGYDHPWPAGGGKNKFDVSKMVNTSDITINNGVISVTGNAKNSNKKLSELADLTVGETYILTATTTGTENIIYLYGTGANVSWQFGTSKTITQEMLDALVMFYGGAGTTSQISNFMIRLSSVTDATYAPYSNICPISGRTGLSVYVSPTQDQQDATTYAVDWTSEAGTVYGGTDNPVTGDLASKYGMVDLGTLSASGWIYDSNRKGFTHTFAAPANANIMCSHYPIGVYADWANASKTNLIFYVKASNAIYLKTPYYTDGASLSAALSGVQMVYELATPLTYQLTPQEVETLVGVNNIWADTGEEITVEVVGPSTLDNPTPFDALPLLTVSGEGAITINDRTILIQEAVEDFEIDCESGESDDNSKIYCMEFPVLHGGQNLITCDSTITSLSLIPRWWTL